jgi:hypothetical protein
MSRKTLHVQNPLFGNCFKCWRDLFAEWGLLCFLLRVGEEDLPCKSITNFKWFHSPHFEGDPWVGREELVFI